MVLSKEQQRKMETLHSSLSPLMHKHYTEVHDVVIDADIAFVDQTTMGEVITSLGDTSASYTFTLEPLSGPAMIDYSQHVADAFIKKMLGKKEDGRVNAEERKALHQIFERDLENLLSVWVPVETFTARDAEFETDPECLNGAIARGEGVILVAWEIHGPDFSGLVNVVL
ncbi:MAG: hypothetical protein QGG64_18695, partial [Candidatus Latescibacteria bacterium]|nr:hypothetical protein [Candidatus Latescibacterota bacterium]